MIKPVIELSDCINCEICVGLCPDIFKLNDAGFIEVIELTLYSEECIKEAVKNCPKNCIYIEKNI